jgi:hypothetical protein
MNIVQHKNKLCLLHSVFGQPIIFHQFMENRMADFCLFRRGRPPKLVKFYVKPLVDLVMYLMIPRIFRRGIAVNKSTIFILCSKYM